MNRLRPAIPVAAAAAFTLLALAACGGGGGSGGVASMDGSSHSGTTGTSTTGTKDPQEAALEFAKCMREHGVDMPDPKFGKGGIVVQKNASGDTGVDPDDPTFKAAQKACQPIVDKAAREAGLPTPKGPSTNRSGGAGPCTRGARAPA